jgi:sulfur carrier protein
MLNVILNGEPKELPEQMTVEKAIAYWQPNAKTFAVAVNGEFLPRDHYADSLLQAGDQIELLSPIVGG